MYTSALLISVGRCIKRFLNRRICDNWDMMSEMGRSDCGDGGDGLRGWDGAWIRLKRAAFLLSLLMCSGVEVWRDTSASYPQLGSALAPQLLGSEETTHIYGINWVEKIVMGMHASYQCTVWWTGNTTLNMRSWDRDARASYHQVEWKKGCMERKDVHFFGNFASGIIYLLHS